MAPPLRVHRDAGLLATGLSVNGVAPKALGAAASADPPTITAKTADAHLRRPQLRRVTGRAAEGLVGQRWNLANMWPPGVDVRAVMSRP